MSSIGYYEYMYYLNNIQGTQADPSYQNTNDSSIQESKSTDSSYAALNMQGKDTLETMKEVRENPLNSGANLLNVDGGTGSLMQDSALLAPITAQTILGTESINQHSKEESTSVLRARGA